MNKKTHHTKHTPTTATRQSPGQARKNLYGNPSANLCQTAARHTPLQRTTPLAPGHSQEVLHHDADDRAFHERPGRLRRRRRRRGRALPFARDLRRGISRESSLRGKGAEDRRLPARSRHPGLLSRPPRLPSSPICGTGAPAPRSRETARRATPPVSPPCACAVHPAAPAPRLSAPTRPGPAPPGAAGAGPGDGSRGLLVRLGVGTS